MRPLFVQLTHQGTPVAVNVRLIAWFLANPHGPGAYIRVAGIEGGLEVEESVHQIAAQLDHLCQPDRDRVDTRWAAQLSARASADRTGTPTNGDATGGGDA